MPLPMIERRVMPFMGGADYLGPEFNGRTYRLKFMRGGRVIWIDVDGRAPAASWAAAEQLIALSPPPSSFRQSNRSSSRVLRFPKGRKHSCAS
jgi:hypothetical protein